MFILEKEIKILTATSAPYNVNGNSGTSHKVRFLLDNSIFTANSNQEQVKYLKNLENETVTAQLKFSSPKENLKLEIESIEQ